MTTAKDPLRDLLIEFFQLPPETAAHELSQQLVAKWDSLAMVQLITELQSVFSIEFDLDQIDKLGSYEQIRAALVGKGVRLE